MLRETPKAEEVHVLLLTTALKVSIGTMDFRVTNPRSHFWHHARAYVWEAEQRQLQTCLSPCGLPLGPSPLLPLGLAVVDEAILSASCAASALSARPPACPELPACCPQPGGLPSALLAASRLLRWVPPDRRCPLVVTTAGPAKRQNWNPGVLLCQ